MALLPRSARAAFCMPGMLLRRIPRAPCVCAGNVPILAPLGFGAARLLAKKAKGGKTAKAGKGGKKAAAADPDDDEDEVDEVDMDALSKSMEASTDYVQRELAGFQAGRATPTMLDQLQVAHAVALLIFAVVSMPVAHALLVMTQPTPSRGRAGGHSRRGESRHSPTSVSCKGVRQVTALCGK